MNLLKTFEQRVSDAFGGASQGFVAPISFRKLAKRAAREMEAETYEISGTDTAPALYTILVSGTDDTNMRPFYSQLTHEITSFIEAQAQTKGYVFVGKPLARFMVDPSLRSGKFAVFAENVDASTLKHLRAEEEAFLSGSLGLGGAAAKPFDAPHVHTRKRPDEPLAQEGLRPLPNDAQLRTSDSDQAVAPANLSVAPAMVPTDNQAPVASNHEYAAPEFSQENISQNNKVSSQNAEQEFAPLIDSKPEDASAGLNVIPESMVDAVLAAPVSEVAYVPQVDAQVEAIPATQRRNVPLVNPQIDQTQTPAQRENTTPASRLIDRQSGRIYSVKAPSTAVGRERVPGGIVLRDPNVSRRHAEIVFDGQNWNIRDLGSTNGTLVNDVDIDSCILHDGDLITIGLLNLEFREN